MADSTIGDLAVTVTTPASGAFLPLDDGTGADKITWENLLGGGTGAPVELVVACSDETTAITTGLAKVSFRMPFAMTLNAGNLGVKAALTTSSSSGIPTFDINEAGVTILSTKLTIDASETTSKSAATAVVISDTALADDAVITIDFDVAGTGAAGGKSVV